MVKNVENHKDFCGYAGVINFYVLICLVVLSLQLIKWMQRNHHCI